MPSTKSATPVPAGHATETLKVGSAEEIASLAKLNPVILPNDTLVASLQESHPEDARWRLFRNDANYLYVVNWLFQCRGYIRLASEHFDTDLFEIELFELVNPPPVDDMALLINKVKLALISKVHGKKVLSLAMFETLFRVYFGNQTPLSGPAEDETGDDVVVSESSKYPSFDNLFIDEKLSILSMLITEVSLYPEFRDYIDKAKILPESLRLTSVTKIATRDSFRGEEYLLLFDGTALYKRTVSAPELVIPKKRKLAPENPELHYPEDVFDIASESIHFELIYKDIYGLDLFVKDLLKNKKLKTNKAILDVITGTQYVSNVYSYEIRKRKIISGRKKEFEMARLLATRKRSSRIEAKEKQKHLEEQERKAQEMEDLKYATSRRSQRAQNQYEQRIKMDYTAGLSRGERLGLRKEKVDSELPADEVQTGENSDNVISIESSPRPIDINSTDTEQPLAETPTTQYDGGVESITSLPSKEPESKSENVTTD